jgi:hypothetical protein
VRALLVVAAGVLHEQSVQDLLAWGDLQQRIAGVVADIGVCFFPGGGDFRRKLSRGHESAGHGLSELAEVHAVLGELRWPAYSLIYTRVITSAGPALPLCLPLAVAARRQYDPGWDDHIAGLAR